MLNPSKLQRGSLLALGLLVGFNLQDAPRPREGDPIGPVRASAFILVSERGEPLAELRSEEGITELVFWPVGETNSESRASFAIMDGLAQFELTGGGGKSSIRAQCFGSTAKMECSGEDGSDEGAMTIASIHASPSGAEVGVLNGVESKGIGVGPAAK